MFEPSKEMGAFMAHVMYEELEKIAKYRSKLPGGTNLLDIAQRLDRVAKMTNENWFQRNVTSRSADGRARAKLLEDIQGELYGAQTMASRQAKSELGSGFDRNKANLGADTTKEIRELLARTERMQQGMSSGKGGPLPKRCD
jgi:hypothetical protein